MLVGVLASPVALAVLLGLAFVAVALAGSTEPTGLSWARLSCALVGVALFAVVAAAASSYVSPEESRKFGVAEDHRWSAIWNQFIILAVLSMYVGIAGASLVAIPLVSLMARKGLASTPGFVLASVPVSLIFALPFALQGGSPRGLSVVAFFIGGHAWLALGFALGARLPWLTTRNE